MAAASRTPLLPALLTVAIVLVGAWTFVALGRARTVQDPGDVDGARYRLTPAAARLAGVPVVPAGGALRFAPATAPADRQAIVHAVAAAHPEARRLVSLVAGTVVIGVGTPHAAVGEARRTAGGYAVTLDLAAVQRYGERGIARLALHELGHVVDHALVTSDLERRLDAATPRGWGCDDGGRSGACAEREERFAESFAKWATGDIGEGIHLGYRVPPPPPSWGEPLRFLR